MPYPADKTYPAVATNTAWQKQKSFLDKTKIKNKTGVGPKLVAAQAAWGLIPFADLDDSKNKPTNSTQSQKSLNKAIAAAAKVATAHDALDDAITTATMQSTNKDLNSTSRTALKAIVVALKAADKRLKDMSDLVSMFMVDHNNVVKDETEKAQKAQLALAQAKAKADAQAKLDQAELTLVKVKSGSSVVAIGTKATRQSNNGYWVTGTAWKTTGRHDDLTFLQKKLTLEGKDKGGHAFSKEMTLKSIVGNGTLKFE